MLIPLSTLLPRDIIPAPFDQIADQVAISGFGATPLERGFQCSLELSATSDDLAIDIGGDSGVTLVFRQLAELFFSLGDEIEVRIGMSELVCQLPTFLRPATQVDGEWVPDASRRQELLFKSQSGGLQLVWHSADGFSIRWPQDTAGNLDIPAVTLGQTMIGDSGVVISANAVDLLMDFENPVLSFQQAAIHLPDTVPSSPDLVFDACTITRHGFTGTVHVVWDDLTFDETSGTFNGSAVGNLFGLSGGLDRFSLEFRDNVPVATDIQGGLVVPYFDEPALVQLGLGAAGNFTITLRGADGAGIILTREELLALTVQRLTVDYNHERMTAALVVSGGLEPLLMAADGLEWPRLDVTDLSIEQDLTDLTNPPVLKFKEAWLDLKDLATLDLWGFHFELNRVGLGYEEPRDRLWVDLTGSLRLIEHIPVGLGVEGFRLSWPRTIYEMLQIDQAPTLDDALAIAGQLEVQFDGVYLFYGVPQAVEFEGYIRFIKQAQKIGFAGDVVLRVPASGFSAEAGLMVGMNFAQPFPYPFLYVYLGVELPKGIPLGQSGLALKGALGLFGLNVAPDKTPDQNWYYDWYKREPFVGAHQTNKWRDEFLALALGIGVTITTVDGYIKGVRGLLVLAIPGPILVIEGRSLILDGLLPAEPPLRALAVFDGHARTVQFNIEAEAELIEDMLDAYGMLEAFFDFADLTNWHLYLGQDEPRDRRIQANILKFRDVFLFKADAYLMIDMVGARTLRSRMGVFVGFKPPIPSFGPVQINLDAVLEGGGVATVLPEQFSGDVSLSANVELTAFGFGLQLAAGADVLVEGPRPLSVEAELHVRAELPLPLAPAEEFLPDFAQDAIPDLPPLEVEVALQLSWQAPEPPAIAPPLVAVTVDSPFAPGGGALEVRERAALQAASVWRTAAEHAPVAPLDARPLLGFAHQMNDVAGDGPAAPTPAFARHPDGREARFDAGLMRFTPAVSAVRLYEHRKGQPWPASLDDWQLVASSRADEQGGPVAALPGAWLAEADPEEPGRPPARRLQLWTSNPLLHAADALGPGYGLMLGLQPPGTSLAESLLELHPDLHACQFGEARRVCVPFDTPAPTPNVPRQPWLHHGLRLTHDGLATFAAVAEANRPPRLDALTLNRLGRDLAAVDPFFARTRQRLTVDTLQLWSASVDPRGRALVRQRLPSWDVVWDWLWPAAASRTCLRLTGARHVIQFPQTVRHAWISFCQPPKLPLADARQRVATHRAAHSLAELLDLQKQAAAKGRAPDLRACQRAVAHQLQADGDTWLVTTEAGFDCLTLVRMGDFAIAEICYLADEEAERAVRAQRQCSASANAAGDNHLLRPGSYYRLEVETSVAGRLREEDLPFGDDPLGAALVGLYAPILETLGFAAGAQTYHHAAFFQTEGPPAQLDRYVMWSSPTPQATGVFRDNDVAIRFRRSYLQAMYTHPPHQMQLLIRSAEGRLLDGYATHWTSAGSASLLREELLWREHANPAAPPEPDDLLLGLRAGAGLAPGARYELLLVGGEGGRLLFEENFDAGLSAERWGPDLAGWQAQAGQLDREGAGPAMLVAGDQGWADVDISAEIKASGPQAAGLLLRVREAPGAGGATVWRACRVVLQPGQQAVRLEGLRRAGAAGALEVATLASQPYAPPDGWARLRVSLVAGRLRVWVFDQLVLDGSLYELNRDWTGAGRPAGTLLWFNASLLDPEHQQALQAGQLSPSAQGALGLYAAGAGPRFRRLEARDAVLMRVPFTTSKFAGFRELVESGQERPPLELGATAPPDVDRQAAAQAAVALARARWRWQRDQVDYRFEDLDREGLEASRLALRAARRAHDAAFRALAEAVLPGLCFQPFEPHMAVYLLRGSAGQTLGLWLRSPEGLDLRQAATNDAGQSTGHVGRAAWRLERRAGNAWQAVVGVAYHDADSAQLIVLPAPGGAWPGGQYRVRFTYHRDHGDEAGPGDHRYDRPVERRQNSAAPEVAYTREVTVSP